MAVASASAREPPTGGAGAAAGGPGTGAGMEAGTGAGTIDGVGESRAGAADGPMQALAGLPPGLDGRLARRAIAGAAWVQEQRRAGRTVTVVHHIDADGVTAGAVAAETLGRAGIPHVLLPVKSLDDHHVALVAEARPQALWFCDLGSSAAHRFAGIPRLVCDHHGLGEDAEEPGFAHVNPLLDGLPGEDVSGSGCCYLVAAALDARNVDLLPLALVGASGDLQDRRHGRFLGTNARLLQHAQRLGLAGVRLDLAWFGTESRPLRKFLSLASDPDVPGLSRDARGAERLLASWGVDAAADAPYGALGEDVRLRIRSGIVGHLLDVGLADRVPRLFREVVTLAAEAPGTPTRELQEFATLLNGTARYGRPEVGLAVARGDRGAAYAEALDLLRDHRKHLSGALAALGQAGMREGLAVQWVHLQDRVRDTVVGIVCGMALDGLGLRRDLAVVGFAWTPDGRTKASARAPHELQRRGIDLAAAMRSAAEAVGGQGGGHPGAAGATIPRGAEDLFVGLLDRMVAAQVGAGPPPRETELQATTAMPY